MAAGKTSKRVLLVDDEVAVRNLYQISLEQHGMVVFTASGVREGLQALHDLEFDVALVDLQLTDGDGMQIIRKLQRGGNGPKALAMSGFPVTDKMAQELKTQGVDFYSKMEPMAELIRLIVK